MKLIECLELLPDEMAFIDLTEIYRKNKIKTVAQIKLELSDLHKNEEGFEVRDFKKNYGKTVLKSIGLINGAAVYNQSE